MHLTLSSSLLSMNHSWFGNVTLSGSNSFIIKPISGE
jgi:hypothetical protein